MGVLEPARTIEQQIFSEAWQRMYGRLRAELVHEQNRGQQRVHLLSQWAHHMKTPVAVIDLELQKARRTLADVEAVNPSFDSVAEENQRLEHSLQMLLNTIRLDDFAADFRIERVDLPQLVRQVVNDSRRAFIIHRVYPKLEEPILTCCPRPGSKSKATSNGCGLSSSKLSTTPSNTRPGPNGEGVSTFGFTPKTTSSFWKSPMTASASLRKISVGCSNRFSPGCGKGICQVDRHGVVSRP